MTNRGNKHGYASLALLRAEALSALAKLERIATQHAQVEGRCAPVLQYIEALVNMLERHREISRELRTMEGDDG